MSTHKIKSITVRELGDGKVENSNRKESPWLCTPASIFPDFRDRIPDYFGRHSLVIVEIETDTGIIGVGSCGTANA
ncbi:MAG: hypothetical protein EBX92_03630, partial [Actinobacteria bacterium]|nr:hypothetical protein [Actinomycetota bacterium]